MLPAANLISLSCEKFCFGATALINTQQDMYTTHFHLPQTDSQAAGHDTCCRSLWHPQQRPFITQVGHSRLGWLITHQRAVPWTQGSWPLLCPVWEDSVPQVTCLSNYIKKKIMNLIFVIFGYTTGQKFGIFFFLCFWKMCSTKAIKTVLLWSIITV